MKPDDYQKQCMIFLSTPSVRRATTEVVKAVQLQRISIHALRAEGDAGPLVALYVAMRISIHALRVEGDRAI